MKTKTSKAGTLPDLPSEILMLTLADLEAVSKMPDVRFNMGVWVRVTEGYSDRSNGCEVCMAGAVMLNTLKANPSQKELVEGLSVAQVGLGVSEIQILDGYRTQEETRFQSKFRFINHIRTGEYEHAFNTLLLGGLISSHKHGEAMEAFEDSEEGEWIFEQNAHTYREESKEATINHLCAVIGTLQSIGL